MKNARLFLTAGLFLLACAGFAQAQDYGHAPKSMWLPERASSDAVPGRIDHLFYVILWITGIAMVLVFATLVYFLFKYRAVPGRKAKFIHGNHTVELVWTIVPALILVWLGFTQIEDWRKAKVPSSFPTAGEATVVQVLAQQFDWSFRFPGTDGKFETYNEAAARAAFAEAKGDAEKLDEFNPVASRYFGKEDDDDIVTTVLKVPVGKPVLIELRSVDVIHSFFIPVMRLKQDAVPGKPMPVWFKPTKVGRWEIACAELCGNNHTTMKSALEVVTQEEWDAWVREKSAEKTGTIDRASGADNAWKHWFKQGMRPAFGGTLSHDWNALRIEKQEAVKALAGAR